MIPCPLCTAQLRDNHHLAQHNKSNHECKYCNKHFVCKITLKSHIKVCFEKAKLDKECSTCGKRFNHKGNFEAHQKICSLPKIQQPKYECNLCYPCKSFSKNSALVNHLRCHEKEKSYQCEECLKQFSCNDFLKQHMKLHISAFWCNLCNKKFTANQSLKKHTAKFHNENGLLNNLTNCSYCDKSYSNQDNLNRHVKTAHGKMKTNCSYCDKAYCNKDALKRYVKTAHGEFVNVANVVGKDNLEQVKLCCPMKCNIKFGSRLALSAHMNEKHKKKHSEYVCEICEKKFTFANSLRRHKQVEHVEVGEVIQCVLCPYTSLYKKNIDRHMQLTHKTVTPARNKPRKLREELSTKQQKRISQNLSIKDLLKENNNSIKLLGVKTIMKDSVVQEILDELYKKSQITEQDVINIVNNVGLSDNQVIKILKILRKSLGRRIITPNVRKALVDRKRIFGDLFKVKKIKFINKGQEVERWAVIGDAQGIKERVSALRGDNNKDKHFAC